MTDPTTVSEADQEKAKSLALDGRSIAHISSELGISWGEARRLVPFSSWRGAKVKLTRRLEKLATEPDEAKRKKMAEEADIYADFLYDAAKHLRGQVDAARKALDR